MAIEIDNTSAVDVIREVPLNAVKHRPTICAVNMILKAH